jgi:hypothetical protein
LYNGKEEKCFPNVCIFSVIDLVTADLYPQQVAIKADEVCKMAKRKF